MSLPASPDARLFYRCAVRRFEEAGVLRRAAMTTGAVYLAGYAVECSLKSLILDGVPASRRPQVLASFRGNAAHDFEWLRSRYLENGGARFPKEVTRSFTFVASWSTQLRYSPRELAPNDADRFIRATETILEWTKGRF